MPHLAAVFKGCSCRRLCASPSSQGFFVPTQPFEKKGRAFAFLLVALAAGRGGKTPSAFTALLPCFAKAFAARQTAAFTKPKGRNMKQTTISKALCYTRGLTYLLKVMFSVALLPKINFIINLAYYRQVKRCTQSPCNIKILRWALLIKQNLRF